MLEGTGITSVSRETLHEIDGTIESLSRLLEGMRVEHARQSEETDELRGELSRMREREEKLNEALTRLRHWLALDAEAMLGAGISTMPARLAGLEAGAEQLRAEADANKRLAQQSRQHAEASVSAMHDQVERMRDQIDSLSAEVRSVTAERDALRARLEEHETLLKTAGLEIEFRPARSGRSE